jgi:dTDP-4-dehydrorhamnose 3,5-epimerase
MIFTSTPLPGAYLIDIEKKVDERGFFARAFCETEFGEHGLVNKFCQVNNSLSARKSTLRGMHYQLAPRAETKVVRCIRGSLYDMILDLRHGSPTFGRSFGVELSAENRRMMYLPKGVAHGILTLMNDTEMMYLVDEFYSPKHGPKRRRSFPTRTIISAISIRPGTSTRRTRFRKVRFRED